MVDEIVSLLSKLIGSGAQFWVEGERLHYRGPVGLLTDGDERFFQSHRDQIMRVISDGVLVKCLDCGGVGPGERRDDPQYNDLWQGRCGYGCVFSTANLSGIIVSQLIS
jgi:hypothetical protein